VGLVGLAPALTAANFGAKADVNTEDQDQDIALHHACLSGHLVVATLLLKYGAAIDHGGLQGDDSAALCSRI